MNNTVQLKSKEEIEKNFFHIPFWLAPHKDVFLLRSERFVELASQEHTEWKSYLQLLAQVCQVQHTLLNECDIAVPAADDGSVYRLPAYDAAKIPAEFYALLISFHQHIQADLPKTAVQAWQNLLAMKKQSLTALTKRVLKQDFKDEDQPYVVWVHAVLQIIWTHWALQLHDADVPTREERDHCPCCGSDGVGSVIYQKGELEGLRYIQCNLCNSRWHALRAKCTFCGNTKDISFQSVEGVEDGALHGASAECCDECHSYRKAYHLSKEQYADPIADDLASLAVDILVGEQDYARGGANPFLILDQETEH